MLLAKNINKKIKDKQILKNISFEVGSGECVALIGPNGAGKTTLFRTLLGEYKCEGGSVKINGTNAGDSSLKEYVAVLNQENAVPDKLKVKELINFYKTIYKDSLTDKEIDNILQFTPTQKNQLVSKLSGGQKRFLIFVLTLIGKPKILFLDEPTAAMDTSTRKRFWEVIETLKEQGLTIVYSSHYIEEVEHTADRILVLSRGELVRDTTPYALKAEEVEKHFTLPTSYIDVVNELANVSNIEIKKDNISFITTKANTVWQKLAEAGCQISDIEIQNRTLLSSVFNTTKEEE